MILTAFAYMLATTIGVVALYILRWIVYPHAIVVPARYRSRRLIHRMNKWWAANRPQLLTALLHRTILLLFFVAFFITFYLFA